MEMHADPLVEDEKAPRTRPGCAGSEEILPDAIDTGRIENSCERRSEIREACGDALAERTAEPFRPRKREGALGLGEELGRKKIADGLDEESFGGGGWTLLAFGEGENGFDQRYIKERDADFE